MLFRSYDLNQHAQHSGQKLDYFDQATNERYVPYVIEPAAGVNRAMAAFLLAAFDNSYDLPKAIATVSLLPAQAVGLDDRGEIRPGLRADLLQASDRQGQPVVRQVWRQGRRVF